MNCRPKGLLAGLEARLGRSSENHFIVQCTIHPKAYAQKSGRRSHPAPQQMKDLMRIFSLAITVILAAAASGRASAENMPTSSPNVASLRCVQFAMVREHHHGAAGWPTDCGSQMSSRPRRGWLIAIE